MMIRLGLPMACLALATPLWANECRGIAADAARLACYDAIFADTGPEAPAPPPESAWEVRVETSAMTDETNVYMTVTAEEPVICGYGGASYPRLMVRCREDTTAIIFHTECHMTSSRYNSYGDVTYRLDDDPPATRGFQDSTDNRALGLWSGRQAIPFIRAMFGHDTMLTRMTPYGRNAFEARFDIAGLEEEIAPLRAACGW